MQKKKKILVIDDDKMITRFIQTVLEQTDQYEVLALNQPKMASRTVQEFRPDLVFLDVVMPEMDGGAVAAEIREVKRNLPIIFLTSVVSKEEAAANDGVIGKERFLAKPVNVAELQNAVRKIIG